MRVKNFCVGPLATNMYICSDEKNEGFIVDCPYKSNEVLEYIKEEKIDIKFILLTHTHVDHVLGAKFFSEKLNVPIYASEDSRDIYEDVNYNLSDYMAYPIEKYEIDEFLLDKQIIEKFNIICLKTPGHTIDSMSFALEDIIFSGDTIFKLSIGRTDFAGGDYNSIIHSIKERILVFDDDTKIYPGHGESTNVLYEKENNPFVN
ncbi:MAG: MBL fold metallo-hydrolase [Tissierellia bacterium]|nr:MBL fold metallo-hydrolase [Tissierellia bacterium]